MERSIDHLVATHKLAQERRKAGKQVWDRTIKIKDIIDEDEANATNAHAVKVAKAIAERLEAGVPPAWRDIQSPQDYDDDLWDILYMLRGFSVDDEPEGKLVEELNGALSQLFDWADMKRVWLG